MQSLISLLGFSYSEICQISPVTKLHIMRVYINRVMESGMLSYSLRNNNLCSLEIFQRKSLKSVLKFSTEAPNSSLFFLTGEIPIKAQLHQDIFSLFHNVWSNPESKIDNLVAYLLEMSSANSHTWCAHVRNLSRM